MTYQDSISATIHRYIEAGLARITDAIGDEFPLQYELDDIRERDEHVDALAHASNFKGLRRSRNGRALLALWQVRSIWREQQPLSQDDVASGYAPLDEEARELEKRLAMDDEALAYSHRLDLDDDYEQQQMYEDQDTFVQSLSEQRRQELVDLLKHIYGDRWNSPQMVDWVKGRIAAKHGNALRGYASCLASLKKRMQ